MTTHAAGAGRDQRQDAEPQPTTGSLIARLNTSWRLVGSSPASLKQRVAYPLRRLVARLMGPQESFNSAVVQYVNATSPLYESTFDEVRRHGEALAARERRVEAAMTAIRAQQQELQISVGVLQQATHNLARDIERLRLASDAGGSDVGPLAAANGPLAPAREEPRSDALSHKYVGFEDQFRGSREAIREQLASYVPLFVNATDVLDIGCGRGEFLKLLREHGIRAQGIDVSESMIEVCREQSLEARCGDALSYLRGLSPGSLGGVFAAQVVEHLEPGYLTQLLDAAFAALRPGAPIVLETINPACWFAFFESYVRDITHVRPLHPDTLRFLLVATGFQRVEVAYRAPYPDHEKLQPVTPAVVGSDVAETLNANVEKINRLLFTHLDYAAIGYRP